MDAQTGTPLYSSEPPAAAAAAAAENPSAASVGAATVGAPSTVGLTRNLFLPPRMTTPTGGVARAPSRATVVPSRAAAVGSKKGKTSGKKKAADGSGSSKTKKKLAGRRTGAASTEAPASSLIEPAADAHHVFDEMPPSLNDDAYMSTMGVGSNNSHWSQTNDIHLDDHEFETRTTKKGKIKKGKIFTLPHCYEVLKDDEKWKKREDLDDLHLSNKRKRTIELNDDEEEDDASSDEGTRSPTPNSVSYSKPKTTVGASRDAVRDEVREEDSSTETEESSSEDEDEDEEDDE
ncbi:UDP-glycosyltransferase 73C6 [Hordeum vulgare]|nr:UDP-glycosyltransferase 73C6 [Hordeum vulgare]